MRGRGVWLLVCLLFMLAAAAAFAQQVEIDINGRKKPPRAQQVDMVALGRRLFTEETFGGNGRTCATCHPLGRNTQLTLADIAALPDRDPLFVAEFMPALAFTPNGPKFEVPPLMRADGLICENQDGFGDLVNGCNMRSIPHTLGLPFTITPVPGDLGPGVHATGWSGNGAPGDGSLRMFAAGAVVQHFTRTLQRRPGIDFRPPTDLELDAMLAFQLSLGRRAELALPLMFVDPVVLEGQRQFMRSDADSVDCQNCHNNAGANGRAQGANRMNATGVEQAAGRPTEVILAALGIDLTPNLPGLTRLDDGVRDAAGVARFNAASLIEAADTPPFFHDNSCRTLECAVGHYVSPAFNASGNDRNAVLSAPQIEAIAAFLRTVNALENLRSADVALQQALQTNGAALRELTEFARGEIADAQVVLEQASLYPAVVAALAEIRERIPRGQIASVRHDIAEARAAIVEETL